MKSNIAVISLVAQGHVLSKFLSEFVQQLNKFPDQPLIDFYLSFEKHLGIPHKEGYNVVLTPGALLGILYLVILLPQQKSRLRNPSLVFDGEEWGPPVVELWNTRDPRNLDVLIRRLRNSLAHSRIQFEPGHVIFEDRPRHGDVDFRVRMSLDSLSRFSSRLAYEFFDINT